MCHSNNIQFCMFKSIDNFCDEDKYIKYYNACEIGQDKIWIHDVCRENTIQKNLPNLNVSKVSHHTNIHRVE